MTACPLGWVPFRDRCYLLLLLFCVYPHDISQTSLAEMTACPLGWVPFRDHCYLFSNVYQPNRKEAQRACQRMNAYLVEIDDAVNIGIKNNLLMIAN